MKTQISENLETLPLPIFYLQGELHNETYQGGNFFFVILKNQKCNFIKMVLNFFSNLAFQSTLCLTFSLLLFVDSLITLKSIYLFN